MLMIKDISELVQGQNRIMLDEEKDDHIGLGEEGKTLLGEQVI